MSASTSPAPPSIGGVPLTPKSLEALGPPRFETPEQERRHRQQHLVAALRIFGRFGFGEGVAGHITVRDPEFPDHFWVNPFARSFRRLTVSDLLLVNHAGEVVIGHWPVNRAAFVLHAALHASRPEVQAAAHAHSPHGKAFSSLGRLLDPITQDSCMFFDDHVLVQEDGGKVVLEEEAGQRFAAAFSHGKAAIHQNHGLFTVGQTVDEAAYWFIAMERSCHCQLLAEAAGTPRLIRREWAAYTRERTGTALAGWLNFQTLFEDVILTDPELFS